MLSRAEHIAAFQTMPCRISLAAAVPVNVANMFIELRIILKSPQNMRPANPGEWDYTHMQRMLVKRFFANFFEMAPFF